MQNAILPAVLTVVATAGFLANNATEMNEYSIQTTTATKGSNRFQKMNTNPLTLVRI